MKRNDYDDYRVYQERRQERRLHKQRLFPHYQGNLPLVPRYELAAEDPAPRAGSV